MIRLSCRAALEQFGRDGFEGAVKRLLWVKHDLQSPAAPGQQGTPSTHRRGRAPRKKLRAKQREAFTPVMSWARSEEGSPLPFFRMDLPEQVPHFAEWNRASGTLHSINRRRLLFHQKPS
jgi:hypothetical protein